MQRQRPRLKNGVDLQLQSAFSDGNWPLVVRLAEKRAKTMNDDYYDVLKVCAESQVDDPVGKFAAVAAVQKYLKEGTVIKDVDAIDLLEWATLDLVEEDDFSHTLGPLRVKAVKASPKDRISGTRHLESCLVHWDLASAQQIAAILDRSFPQERHFMFWNIAVTHLLSTSPQTSPDKRKLYGTLAQRQIERAADAAEQASKPENNGSPVPRSIQTEEEVLLLYDIIATHGSAEDYEKLTNSVTFSPVHQFSRGSKEILIRAINKYKQEGNWKTVFDICEASLSRTDDDGNPDFLASDLAIWKDFITAANYLKLTMDTAPKIVQSLLLKLIKSPSLKPIYKKNLLLARLNAAFQLAPHDGYDSVNDQASSTRLRELFQYIGSQSANPACFDDVKSYVERLDQTGIKHLVQQTLPQLCDAANDERHLQRLQLLGLKLQYFIMTSPINYTTTADDKFRFTCTTCAGKTEYQSCQKCFNTTLRRALELYESIAIDSPDRLSTDEIPAELIILAAFCNIKLASSNPDTPCSKLSADSFRYIIRALLLLERQLAFSPKNSQLLLLLLQLHLLVGSAPRSCQLFEELAIKRTIMDSLAPLFYDRLTTVAPALLSPSEDLGYRLMDMLTSHYVVSLRLRMPRRLTDAFEANSYSSVLEIPKYITNLRDSCTRAMSLVEEVRSERMLGCPTWELLSDLRFTEVTDETTLKSAVDYGSFPSWDSALRSPIYARLRLGPTPNNRRMHISLLVEAFHDVLGYKPPPSYKVAANSLLSEQTFVLESLGQINNSMAKFLPGTDMDFTAPEYTYFELVTLLTSTMLLCADGSRASGNEQVVGQLIDAATAALDTIGSYVPGSGSSQIEETVGLLTNLHAVGIYREAAEATSLATTWILDFNNREKERDRSGQSNLPKEIVSKTKSLQTSVITALKQGKSWVVALKSQVKAGDFQTKLKNWVFSGDDGDGETREKIREIVDHDFVVDLVAHMKDNVEGWQHVKWE